MKLSILLRSLQPAATSLSPKPQIGAVAVLLGCMLQRIESDQEHGFLFVVQGHCCVMQVSCVSVSAVSACRALHVLKSIEKNIEE